VLRLSKRQKPLSVSPRAALLLFIYLPIYATAALPCDVDVRQPACRLFFHITILRLPEINTALRVNQIYANGFGIGLLCAPKSGECAILI
jgi:hypothetical protein